MAEFAELFAAGQKAALRGSAELKAAMGLTVSRIYAEVPADAPLPYVVIGDDQVLPGLDDPEIAFNVHVWAKTDGPNVKGSDRARAICGVVSSLFDAGLTLAGFDLVEHASDGATYTTDPDGSVHGICSFRYLYVRTTD